LAFKVLIPMDIAAAGKDYLTQHGYEIKMGTGQTDKDVIRDIVDCDAILVRTTIISKPIMEAGKKLKIIARHGVGYDNIDVEAAAELGIQVTNAPESNSRSVAEFTMGMIIAAAKKITLLRDSLYRGDFFLKNKNKGIDLEGKTLGVAGFGRIGSTVAKMAACGFDMKVLAYDPFLPKERFPEYAEYVSKLEDLLSRADIVTLHMPITAETTGIIGKSKIGLMKKTAILVNCARGEIVKEEDLAEALRDGVIAGAAVDVYAVEPPPAEHPLLALANVVATPHMASNTNESMDNMALHAAMEIHRVLSGEGPKWPVNKPAAT
jgi:D-3-phosphoglycerate dehydrogenase